MHILSPVTDTDEAFGELTFWQDNIKILNSKCSLLKKDLSCEIEVFCDASSEGYGGYVCLVTRKVLGIAWSQFLIRM